MAFNYYPSYQAQYQPQFQYQPQPPQNSILWVQGIEGAKAYPVGAGNSVLLMDSDSPHLYIKSADNTGLPSLRVFEYTEITDKKEEKPKVDMSVYVTKDELQEVIATLKPKKKKVIEVEDDE